MRLICITVLLFGLIEQYSAKYTPPNAKVEPLHPRGIRISVPDEDGISLVAFHAKINDDFTSLEAGTISVDVIKAKNGRWTYQDKTTRLKSGDVVYYWVHVVYDGLGYNLLNQEHTVTQFYNYDGTPVSLSESGATCAQASITQVVGQNGERRNTCAGNLIFEDNFDSFNTSRWTPLEQFSRAPDYEFVVYMNNNEILETKDGILNIKPIFTNDKYGPEFVRNGNLVLERCTGVQNTAECKRHVHGSQILPPVISGRLNTKGLFSFTYGRIEVRAKLPAGDWVYPLISLEYPYHGVEDGATHYEVRIASSSGNKELKTAEGIDIGGRVLWGGVLATNFEQGRIQATNRMTLPKMSSQSPWSDDYHVYELEWRPDRVVVKVDGRQYGEQPVSAALQKPFYINIGLAVGGHSEFPDYATDGTRGKPWRNIESKALLKFYDAQGNWKESWRNGDACLHIDYIKVYAL